MTRILHVSQATTAGVGRYLEALITHQSDHGWDVSLASPPDEVLESLCTLRSTRHHRWDARRNPGPSSISEMRALARIVGAVNPDVVHLHSSKAGLAGRLVLRGRAATVFTPHGWSFFVGGRLTRSAARRWERLAARWADILLCVGDAERTRGEDAGVRGTWRAVANSVDLERFAPASERERADLRDRFELAGPTVVCVGRLAEQKGQDLLVGLWPSVRAAVPDATLVLVGDGPSRTALEGAAGVGVRFVGSHANVRDWLVAADVVASPSRWEGLSLVILEALASGCSIVASRADGMREALGDGGGGRDTDGDGPGDGDGAGGVGALVPVGDDVALRDAIVARLVNPDLVADERRRARERAQRFGSTDWGARVDAVLEEAMALHRARDSNRARRGS